MKLIDRYVNAVIGRLPEATRADVAKELRSNIEDMLPENPDDAAVKEVLNELGNPVVLAEKYRGTKRYLIGPGLYDAYVKVLTIMIEVVATIALIATSVKSVMTPPVDVGLPLMFSHVLIDIMVSVIDAVGSAFASITLIFVILERSGITEEKMPFSKRQWTVDNLEAVEDYGTRAIKSVEPILGLGFLSVWATILIRTPSIIGWYPSVNGRITLAESLFNEQVLHSYLPGLYAVIALSALVMVLKLIWKRWSPVLATVNAIDNLVTAGLAWVMLSNE